MFEIQKALPITLFIQKDLNINEEVHNEQNYACLKADLL